GDLPSPRTEPEVTVLEDGTVLVVGGQDADGLPTGSVFSYDLIGRRFVEVVDREGVPLLLPALSGARAVPMVGSRMAWVGGHSGEGPRRGVSWIIPMAIEEGTVAAFERVDWPEALPADLQDQRATGLADGRLLVTGTRKGRAEGWLLDLGHRTQGPVGVTRAGGEILFLEDGTTLSTDGEGSSLWRQGLHSPFDAPPSSYLPGGATDL
ncbi:MAG: hypothetical protein KC416_17895, partial [Myxococcales bacterium]|nr:hypothetical protein [Myxococcales bacterium]